MLQRTIVLLARLGPGGDLDSEEPVARISAGLRAAAIDASVTYRPGGPTGDMVQLIDTAQASGGGRAAVQSRRQGPVAERLAIPEGTVKLRLHPSFGEWAV